MSMSRMGSPALPGESRAKLCGWVGVSVGVFAFAACGGNKPPPRAAEVPIDQYQAPTGPPPPGDPVAAAAAGASEPAAPVETAAPAGSGAAPTPLPANNTPAPVDVPPYPAPGAHAKPAKALRLAAADCARLSDRYYLTVGLAQGLTAAQATKAAPALKTQAKANASFAAGETSCVSQNTRKQYTCAMKSTTPDAWKACLE